MVHPDGTPREPATIWQEMRCICYELAVRNGTRVFAWIEVRWYEDGRCTVTPRTFPRARAKGFDI